MPLLTALGAFSLLRSPELLHQIVPAGLHVEGVLVLTIVAWLRPEVIGVSGPPMVMEVADQSGYWSTDDLWPAGASLW